MNRLQALQQERGLVSKVLKDIDKKIMSEKLTIALKSMSQDEELMKALKLNTGGK